MNRPQMVMTMSFPNPEKASPAVSTPVTTSAMTSKMVTISIGIRSLAKSTTATKSRMMTIAMGLIDGSTMLSFQTPAKRKTKPDGDSYSATTPRGFVMGEHCILVIEDQEDLAELYETTLVNAGYSVRPAFSGEEGIAEFRANGADVVLLDMTLPEMHGTQVLREIRDLNASVPVIVVSAEASDSLREECRRLGVQDHLSERVNHYALVTGLQLALDASHEDAEVITLRLPARIVRQPGEVDPSLERAITRLAEQWGAKTRAVEKH